MKELDPAPTQVCLTIYLLSDRGHDNEKQLWKDLSTNGEVNTSTREEATLGGH